MKIKKVEENKLYRSVAQRDWKEVVAVLESPEGKSLARDDATNGSISIHLAIFNEAPDEVIESLIDANKYSIRKKSKKNKWLPLHIAVCYGASSATIERLIWMYPDALESKDYIGKTPRDYLYLEKLDEKGQMLISSVKNDDLLSLKNHVQQESKKRENDTKILISSQDAEKEADSIMIKSTNSPTSILDYAKERIEENVDNNLTMDRESDDTSSEDYLEIYHSISQKEEESPKNLQLQVGHSNSIISTPQSERRSLLDQSESEYRDQPTVSTPVSASVTKMTSILDSRFSQVTDMSSRSFQKAEENIQDIENDLNELENVVSSYAEQLFRLKNANTLLQIENQELRQRNRKLNVELKSLREKATSLSCSSSRSTADNNVQSLFLRPCL